ncbi:MAG: HEAT repeat domain-containing protein [Planctomycetota bacterium]
MRVASFALSLAIASLFALPVAADPTAPLDAKSRVAALQVALKATDEPAKKTAIENCGATPHAATASALAAVLSKESDALRIAAAQSLGRMKGIPEAVQVLHGGIGANLKKPAVLEAIFAAVGALADRGSIAVCRDFAVQFVSSKEAAFSAPVKAALEALGQIRHKDSVDALVTARAKFATNAGAILADTMAVAEGAAGAAQEKLTGGNGARAAVFAKWWKSHGSEFNDDLTPRPVGMRRGGYDGGY